MNLFTRIKEKRQKVQFAAQSLERSVLEAMLRYSAQIPLPEPSGGLEIGLLEKIPGGRRGEAPYYLQFFSDKSREGWLNAGYAAGQTAAYMKFRGIAASVLRELPDGMQQKTESGLQCAAVLAFGCQENSGKRSRTASAQETSCIRVERGEQWCEEILDFVKRHGLTGTEFTHMVYRDGRIHFLLKAAARKHPQQAAVDAGILIAGIMAAAEELWIDLELVKQKEITEAGYLISIAPKQENGAPMREMEAEDCGQRGIEITEPDYLFLAGQELPGKPEPQIRYA